ncbi:MAG: hypothetical protein H6719_13830 [Sandaracinaceae bacterium]|nr:hypothetical protein [Sandaracinaceae bacterium]
MKKLALLALLALGCEPQTSGKEYLCARGGQCPPTHFCWADGVCRNSAPSAEIAESCVDDMFCSTRVCADSVDPMANENKYCSTECATDSDCAGFPLSPMLPPERTTAYCRDGVCRAPCDSPVQCPTGTGTECWVGITMDPMLPMGGYCFHLERQDLNGSRACDGNAGTPSACQLPGWCVQLGDRATTDIGLCSMICETRPMTNQCPIGSACAPLVGGFGQCMIPCPGGESDCTDPDLFCTPHSNGTSYCMPSSWAGMTFPLSGMLPSIVQMGGGGMMMDPAP